MSKNLKFIIASIVVVLVVATSIFFFAKNNNSPVVGTLENKQDETTKVKIGYVAVTQSLPVYVAQDKGYFKDQGLEVELVKFEAPNLFADAIIGGQVDVGGYSAATGILSIAESKTPGKFKIIGSNYANTEHPNDVMIIPKDSTATSFSDLKGKTCAILPGPQFKTIFTKIAQNAGLKASESGGSGEVFYKEVGPADHVAALATKSVDCTLGLEPSGSVAIAKGVGKLLTVSPISKAINSPFWGGVAVVTTKFQTENPNTTKKVISAFQKAVKDIQTDENGNRKYMASYLNMQEPLLSNVKLPYFKNASDFTDSDTTEIQKFVDLFKEQGVIKSEVKVKELLLKE